MGHRGTTVRRLASVCTGLLALLGAGAAGAAEVSIETTTGQFYVGEIVEQDADRVRIRTKVHNIVTVLTLSRKEIVSIEDTTLPDTWLPREEEKEPAALATPGPSGGGAEEASSESASGPTYLVIPMHGVIGQDVMAEGLEQALGFARRSAVSHVVLDIDSPGGLVSEALKIGELMRDAKKDLKFVAYVRSAISAAVVPAVSSQWIFYEPEAQIGAAVAFHRESTGSAAVDEKLLSAWAATMAAAAESNGFSADIVRAMVIPRSKLNAWRGPDGEQVVSGNDPPKEATDVRKIDNEKGVLTLTAREASELRFGTLLTQPGIEPLGASVDAPDWKLASDFGRLAMRRAQNAQEEATRAKEQFFSVAESLSFLLQRALSEAPNQNVRLAYHEETGQLTAQSRRSWQRQTDVAIKAWNAVLDAVSELERLDGTYKRFSRESLLDSRKGLKELKEEARSQQRRLKAERNRKSI